MGYIKPKDVTKSYLENAPLPNHGESYTVVSHKSVIEKTLSLLRKSGFTVKNEIYRASMNANVAQGIYHIYNSRTKNDKISNEHELGMRKHTGAANMEVSMHISDQIKNAEYYYTRIINDRDSMKSCSLTIKQQAELTGRLFIEEETLDTQQMTMIKNELSKPSYYYGVEQNNCWAFYNNVTYALKKAHPRNWLQSSQNFHDFIMSNVININTINIKELPIVNSNIASKKGNSIIEVDEVINQNNSYSHLFI